MILTAMFHRRKRRFVTVAIYPNGTEVEIRRVPGLGWRWKQGCGSMPKSAAIENARAEGARIERREVK